MTRAELAGLYVHVPFCSAICPYCDFAVLKAPERRVQSFAKFVALEASMISEPWSFDTVYFGGGTPSALSQDSLEGILEGLRKSFILSKETRICLEANPEDVSQEKALSWRRLGVDFLSLGVQSLDDEVLKFLGRRHDRKQALKAIDEVLEAGIPTVSIDMIFGMESQNPESFRKQLIDVASTGIHHVSCYQLTIHSGTPFAKRKSKGTLHELDDQGQGDLFRVMRSTLAKAGFEGYEVSNYARSFSHRSPHNQKYWNHTPYLGLGPSAHSFDGRSRSWNQRSLSDYEKLLLDGKKPTQGEELLTAMDLALETLMLRLRTFEGLCVDRFEKDFGVSIIGANAEYIDQAQRKGLLVLEGSKLRLTEAGLAITDSIVQRLKFPPPTRQPDLQARSLIRGC